jgi:hypothetical protein
VIVISSPSLDTAASVELNAVSTVSLLQAGSVAAILAARAFLQKVLLRIIFPYSCFLQE